MADRAEDPNAIEIAHLRQAGIRCLPGDNGGWDCIEVSQNGFLGNYETPAAASKELIGTSITMEEQELTR